MCSRVDILYINVKRKESLFCYLSKLQWLRMAGIIGADVECASDERKESLFCYLSKLWWLRMAGIIGADVDCASDERQLP